MTFPTFLHPRPALPTLVVLLVAALVLLPSVASAQSDAAAASPTATPPPQLALAPAGSTVDSTNPTTVSTSGEDLEEGGLDLPISASLTWATIIGTGTFVSGVQGNDLVVSSISPRIAWPIMKTGLTLSAAISGTWFHTPDVGTPLAKNEFLWSDLPLTLSHGELYSNKDKGLGVSGSFAVILPTSLASRFLTRVVSIRPGLGFSWNAGRFSLGANANFTKHFMRSTTPQVDCDKWPDGSQCPGGRDPGDPTFDNGQVSSVSQLEDLTNVFSSGTSGDRTFIASAGVTSFAVAYGLSLGLELVEGLSLSGGLGLSHSFGIRSYDKDGLSSANAHSGRSQTDALTTSLGLSYQIMKYVSVATTLATATTRPFGTDGKDFVVLDFERAPDNITTLSFSVTGSL